jgi:hypothetical protein
VHVPRSSCEKLKSQLILLTRSAFFQQALDMPDVQGTVCPPFPAKPPAGNPQGSSLRQTLLADFRSLFWRKRFFPRTLPAGFNGLLNSGYAVLLSTILQELFGVGLDPTFGVSHVPRERSNPPAYDLMEQAQFWQIRWPNRLFLRGWTQRFCSPRFWNQGKASPVSIN